MTSDQPGRGPGPGSPTGAEDVRPALPELRDRIRAELQPRNLVEAVLVDRIAGLTWRLSRTASLEVAFLKMDYYAQESERTRSYYTRASDSGGDSGDHADETGAPTWSPLKAQQNPVGQAQSVAEAFRAESQSLARLRLYERAALANLEKCLRLLREWQDGGAQPAPGEASPR